MDRQDRRNRPIKFLDDRGDCDDRSYGNDLGIATNYLLEVHAFANEMLINCTSAEVIDNL